VYVPSEEKTHVIRLYAKMAENIRSLVLEWELMLWVSKSKSWTKEKEPVIQNETTFCNDKRYDVDKQ